MEFTAFGIWQEDLAQVAGPPGRTSSYKVAASKPGVGWNPPSRVGLAKAFSSPGCAAGRGSEEGETRGPHPHITPLFSFLAASRGKLLSWKPRTAPHLFFLPLNRAWTFLPF